MARENARRELDKEKDESQVQVATEQGRRLLTENKKYNAMSIAYKDKKKGNEMVCAKQAGAVPPRQERAAGRAAQSVDVIRLQSYSCKRERVNVGRWEQRAGNVVHRRFVAQVRESKIVHDNEQNCEVFHIVWESGGDAQVVVCELSLQFIVGVCRTETRRYRA